jgi:F5/8 type C domain
MFLPFVARGDLHVLVADDAPRLIRVVVAQPGVELIAHRDGVRHYRIPGRSHRAPAIAVGARHAIAALSASCSHEMLPHVLDGDPATRWECGTQSADQEVRIDLGAVVTAGSVVAAIGPYAMDYPRTLVIETSRDGTAWETAWHGPVLAEVMDAQMRSPRAIRPVVAFPPRPARHVRLRQVGRDERWYWSIAELEVWSGAE